jgi:hypothetical protein
MLPTERGGYVKQHISPKQLAPAAVSLILIILLVNTALLARTAGIMNFPGEISKLDIAREGAEMVVTYYEKQAAQAGVLDNSAVRDVLAQMKFDIEKAATPEEVVAVQTLYDGKVKEVIAREQDNKRRETVLSIIKQDPNVAKFQGQGTIGISKSETEGVVISDPEGILSEHSIISLKQNEQMKGTWPLIEVSISDGKAELVTARTLIDRLKLAEDEVKSLQEKLDELTALAGYKEMVGSGIVVKLYDAEEGYSNVDIVHDRDVRDVVNELFAAGAAGVSVGGQRLVSNSSIRCAGPVILVNQQPISVNPIEIHAIGDPQVLSSSLDLIKSQLNEFGIRMEISTGKHVLVPAFKEKK